MITKCVNNLKCLQTVVVTLTVRFCSLPTAVQLAHSTWRANQLIAFRTRVCNGITKPIRSTLVNTISNGFWSWTFHSCKVNKQFALSTTVPPCQRLRETDTNTLNESANLHDHSYLQDTCLHTPPCSESN